MENTDQIDNTDFFAHLHTDDLVTYYTQLLRSRLELIQYAYPGELLEDGDDAIIEHINRCQGILYEKLEAMLNGIIGKDGHYLSKEVIDQKFTSKRKELSELFYPVEVQYFEDVKVNYVHINADLIDIDFYGRDYSSDKE